MSENTPDVKKPAPKKPAPKKPVAKKPAPKKKPAKKKTKKPTKPTPEQIDKLRETEAKKQADERKVAEWEQEQQLKKQYESERADLAPWVGYEAYVAARGNEERMRAIGIVGAIMRGEKRGDIRKKFKISSNKLNAILNSENVDNVLAYSLGHLYSFQDACIKAILHRLEKQNDGYLALSLLEKMGLFAKMSRLIQQAGGAGDDPEETGSAEDIVALMFAKGDSVQARQAREAIERLVIEHLKNEAPDK